MTKGIQQAENAIKAGDTKTGFEILRQVLVEDPESEKAWWIMSGLVQREERATCLEQVLRINPRNQFALDALNELRASPPIEETKPRREIPKAPSGKKPTGKTQPIGKFKTWHYTRGSTVYLTILGDKQLIRAQTITRLIPRVRDALEKGEITTQYLSEIKSIRLATISRVKLLKTALQFHYKDEGIERSARLVMEDENMAERILHMVAAHLGPDYILQTKPIRTGWSLALSAVLVFGAAGILVAGYWAAAEVVSGAAAISGSIQSRFLIALFELIGIPGTVIIGAALIILALFASIRMLLKPALGTELKKRG